MCAAGFVSYQFGNFSSFFLLDVYAGIISFVRYLLYVLE